MSLTHPFLIDRRRGTAWWSACTSRRRRWQIISSRTSSPCRTWRETKTEGVEIGVCSGSVGGLIRSAPVAECVFMVGGCVGAATIAAEQKTSKFLLIMQEGKGGGGAEKEGEGDAIYACPSISALLYRCVNQTNCNALVPPDLHLRRKKGRIQVRVLTWGHALID